MKRCIFVVFAAVTLISAQGYAENQVSFTIEQSIASYAERQSTTKSAGTANKKESENVIVTMPNSLQVCGGIDNFNFYFYPTQPGTAFGLAYMITKDLELGAKMALNDDKFDKANSETSSNSYGIWATLALPAGPGTVELSLPIVISSGVTKDPSNNKDSKINGRSLQLSANYIHPLAKNFSWFGGISYTLNNQVTKDAGSSKVTTDSNELALNLTTFRFTF